MTGKFAADFLIAHVVSINKCLISRPMHNEMILETIAVTKNYYGDKSSGVNNVTILIPKGKITAIVGESGSGKTTLLNLLYGLLQPDAGEVFFKEFFNFLFGLPVRPEISIGLGAVALILAVLRHHNDRGGIGSLG